MSPICKLLYTRCLVLLRLALTRRTQRAFKCHFFTYTIFWSMLPFKDNISLKVRSSTRVLECFLFCSGFRFYFLFSCIDVIVFKWHLCKFFKAFWYLMVWFGCGNPTSCHLFVSRILKYLFWDIWGSLLEKKPGVFQNLPIRILFARGISNKNWYVQDAWSKLLMSRHLRHANRLILICNA